ncbi:MAG: hypothetical protein Kow00124_03190 [Anaerolineae bacterium]
MPLDVFILILRVLIALALYSFLAVLMIFIWRDLQAQQIQHTGEAASLRDQLVVVEVDDEVPLEAGLCFPLKRVNVLGRGPTSTIVIPDPFASMLHATLTYRRGQWWLDDHQSRNGTTVNDVPITGTTVISSGDVIGIGRVKLRLETPR